jgi:hypothetical protein
MLDQPATWAYSHAFAIRNDPDMNQETRAAALTVRPGVEPGTPAPEARRGARCPGCPGPGQARP